MDACHYQEDGRVKGAGCQGQALKVNSNTESEGSVAHANQAMDVTLSIQLLDSLIFLINFPQGEAHTPKAGTLQYKQKILKVQLCLTLQEFHTRMIF